MSIDIKVPMLPESVSDAVLATWHKKVGDAVEAGDNLLDLETDKVMLEVPAPCAGVLQEILQEEGIYLKNFPAARAIYLRNPIRKRYIMVYTLKIFPQRGPFI